MGTTLTRMLTERGYEVTILTRSIRKDRALPQGASLLEGVSTQKGQWQERVAGHEIIINLAGASIFHRWSTDTKKVIRDSRILTTQNLVEALTGRKGKDTVLLSTSAVGYYGFHGDEDLDETNTPGNDFLSSVTQEWEASALEAVKFGARVILCRFGIVLGNSGGALRMMLPLFRWYLGSPFGNGEQWFSWIHQQDLVKIYLFLLNRRDISGPVNCTAPNPVRNKEMTKILGEVLNKPIFMPPVPVFIVKLLMGEFGSVLLEGQKVVPKKLTDAGFHFQFSNIRDALNDLLRK